MISDDIRSQIKSGESAIRAFARNPVNLDGIAATVAGFLNASGGILFIGVDDSGAIVGVGSDLEAEGTRRSVEQALRDRIAPKALFTVSLDVEADRSVITVEVPQGRDGPYAVGGAYWVRRGLETVRFDDAALDQFLRDRAVETQRWERRPSVGMTDSDVASIEVIRLLDDARLTGRFDFTPREESASVFQRLGLTAGGYSTQAADVLFGKHPEVRLPQCRLRYIEYETNKTGDKFIDDRWIVGPLGSVFDQVVERLSATVRIQSIFKPEDPRRSERATYSLAALREGVVNALAHRDYAAFSSGVSVSVYPSRIEIWNSGSLPAALKVADLKKIHPSIPMNPDIAFVLYLRGLMDRLGRGTQKILRGCNDVGARAPKWESKPTGVTLTIYSGGDGDGQSVQFNDRQLQLIERLRPGDSVRAADYEKQAEISDRQARRDLAELEEAGLLQRIGSARATAYRRTEREV